MGFFNWLHNSKLVTFEPKGFRDVLWCPYLNEPWIIEYRYNPHIIETEVHCPNCNFNYEPETHPFICHIRKPL